MGRGVQVQMVLEKTNDGDYDFVLKIQSCVGLCDLLNSGV